MESIENILNEANKCLNCKNAPCKTGCPVNTNIPEFINEIKNNNLKKAYCILQENNILSEVCSNVCPYEQYCMGKCVKGIKEEPVSISKLEKYVNKWAKNNKIKYISKCKKSNEIKVAIIGGGPVGISCAANLAKEGYRVTIFEKKPKIGGLLTYGIPGFRLPRNITNTLNKRVKELGIKIKTNKKLGTDININDLKKDGYELIFIGIGAGITNTYKLSEKECKNIYKAKYVLKEYNAKRKLRDIGKVVIIGGGNVAFDCARATVRMKAEKVQVVYRGSKERMPARPIEVEDTLKDGVEIIYNTKVIGANVKNKKVKELKCIRTEIKGDKVVDIEETDFLLKADTVIFAIGLHPDNELLEKQGIKTNRTGIEVDENNMTNIKGVFAGGDAVEGKSTVCKAVATGKKVAKEMIEYNKDLTN